MNRLADHLSTIALTLWVGGLWTMGYLVAPILFVTLDDKMLAGMLAGRMFTAIALVGLACGAYLLSFRLLKSGSAAFKQAAFWLLLAMLLLTVAGHFGIQPVLEKLKVQVFPRDVMHSVVAGRFAIWHGIAGSLYLVQSLLGLVLVLVLKQGK